MPLSIALTPAAAQHAALEVQQDLPIAVEPAIAVHAGPMVLVGRARSRMAAALRLPANPIARRARLEKTAFATGIAMLGSGVVLAFVPAMRERAAGLGTVSNFEAGMELGAAGVIASAGLVITGISLAIHSTMNMQHAEDIVPQTVPPSPMPNVVPAAATAPATTPAGSSAVVHDIETPAPRVHRLIADASSSGASPAQQD